MAGKPKCVYVDIGHKYNHLEMEAIEKLADREKMEIFIDNRLKLSDLEESDGNIPLRNLFLISIASYYAKTVILALQEGEMEVPDRRPEFLTKVTDILENLHGDNSVIVYSPVTKMTKAEMVQWYVYNNLDLASLLMTVSCYSGDGIPCGVCSACFRRWVAMSLNNIPEEYQVNPAETCLASRYYERAKKGELGKKRSRETLLALEGKTINNSPYCSSYNYFMKFGTNKWKFDKNKGCS